MPLDHVFEIPVDSTEIDVDVISQTKISNGIRAIRGDSSVTVDVNIYNDLVRGYNQWASGEEKKERENIPEKLQRCVKCGRIQTRYRITTNCICSNSFQQ